jgi:hypothetical protein
MTNRSPQRVKRCAFTHLRTNRVCCDRPVNHRRNTGIGGTHDRQAIFDGAGTIEMLVRRWAIAEPRIVVM